MRSDAQLTARVEARNGVANIALSGDLDMATVQVLEERLAPFEADGVGTILLDLRDLVFMDSSGLHALLTARKRAEAIGHRFVVVGVPSHVRRVFEISGTEHLLNDQSVAQTLNQFAGTTRQRSHRSLTAETSGDA